MAKDLINEVVKRWHAAYAEAQQMQAPPPAPPAPSAVTGPGTLMSSNIKLEKPEKYDGNT